MTIVALEKAFEAIQAQKFKFFHPFAFAPAFKSPRQWKSKARTGMGKHQVGPKAPRPIHTKARHAG